MNGFAEYTNDVKDLVIISLPSAEDSMMHSFCELID